MDDTNDALVKLKTLRLNSSAKFISQRRMTDFDDIIGHIEDLLVDDRFYSLQRSFLEKYWSEFEDSEENKHSYMEIFISYTNAIESHITRNLEEKIPGFSMETFTADLVRRKNELDGEVFEVLFTLTDFSAFKEMFLDYRKMKLTGGIDLSSAICILPMGDS